MALHSEHKADGTSDFAKALSTAVAQFYLLKSVMRAEDVVVPFITINRQVVELFVVISAEEKPVWWRVELWDVTKLDRAYSLLAAMYRLIEWVAEFGGRMTKGASRLDVIQMRLLESITIPQSEARTASGEGSSGKRSSGRLAGKTDKSGKGRNDAATSLSVRFDVEFVEQFPRGLQVMDLHSGQIEQEERPWYFATADETMWAKVVDSEKCERGWNEATNLRLLNEEGVVGVPKLMDAWETDEGFVILVTGHCGACVRRAESWDELERHAWELLEALAAVHRAGRVHGDVKESNMCAAPGRRLKLTDWESGVPVGAIPGLCTAGYRAPETARREERVYCEKSDVFSAGVVIRHWIEGLH